MKLLKKETINGKTVLTVEQNWFVFKIVNQFEEYKQITNSFSEWLKLPNRIICSDMLNFQLSAWK